MQADAARRSATRTPSRRPGPSEGRPARATPSRCVAGRRRGAMSTTGTKNNKNKERTRERRRETRAGHRGNREHEGQVKVTVKSVIEIARRDGVGGDASNTIADGLDPAGAGNGHALAGRQALGSRQNANRAERPVGSCRHNGSNPREEKHADGVGSRGAGRDTRAVDIQGTPGRGLTRTDED